MKKSNLILFIGILSLGLACNQQKNKQPIKETKNSKYIALKKSIEKNLMGVWRLHSATFQESRLSNKMKREVISKIKLDQKILIEFDPDHSFKIDKKRIGEWKFNGLNLELKGKEIMLPVPFFCNSQYMVGVQKTYSKLTGNIRVGSELYEVQYILVKNGF